MRRNDARAGIPGRRRTTARVTVAAVVVALGPGVWLSYDLMLRVVYVGAAIAWVAVELRRRTRPETPAEAYSRALGQSSAMHVHLAGVRVAAVHPGATTALLTVTWRSATTVLLDADGRPRGELARNGLTTAYTLSIPTHDRVAVALLAGETGLGRVSVYGTTDLLRNPTGTLRDCGLVLDQYDLEFPSWSGSILVAPELADWES